MVRTGALLLLLAATAAADDLAPKLRAALVKIQATSQTFDFRSPWKMGRQRTRSGRGVVIEPGVILTRASYVQNPLMIMVAEANSARQYPARLKHIDKRIGLALVEVTDPELRARLKPFPVGDPVKLDDEFRIYQLGNDNTVERHNARVTRAKASATKLTLTVQTTCTDGGNGAVALRDGKIVGLLVGTFRSRQEGSLLSVETIRHYLDDFKDGTYQGCPAPSMWTQQMLRDDLRDHHGVGRDHHGMLVTRVMAGRSGHGIVKDGDVLLSVDGYDLDDEGKFTHELHGRLDASWLFQGRRYPGGKILATVLRDGKEQQIEFELRGAPDSEKNVPEGPGTERPQYLMIGGLVVLELNRRLVTSISRSAGGVILRRFNDRAGWDPPTERHRMVYVDRVYQDISNKGFEWLRQTPIRSVNGRPIHRIADVAKAMEKPEGRYHVFRFDGVASDFVIPAADLAAINERIAKTYKITRLRHLAGDPE